MSFRGLFYTLTTACFRGNCCYMNNSQGKQCVRVMCVIKTRPVKGEKIIDLEIPSHPHFHFVVVCAQNFKTASPILIYVYT